jgi:hypothetical protein
VSKQKKAAWLFQDDALQELAKGRNQRGFQRARFYLSENVRADVYSRQHTLSGFCVDLSVSGASIVIEIGKDKTSSPQLVRDELVQIVIKTTEGISDPLNARVVYVGEQKIQDKGYWRINFEFMRMPVNEISNVRIAGVPVDCD